MSPKNILFPVSLTVLGLVGSPAVADAPTPPSAPASAPAPAKMAGVLLLSNGGILKGEIREDAENYTIHQRSGLIRLPRNRVERTFGSMDELYEYRKEQITAPDPDEHMKLARWCLSEGMKEQAKAQLQAVLAISAKHPEARRMLESIEQSELRASAPKRDDAVVRSSVEVVRPDSEIVGRPEGLNSDDYKRARSELGAVGFPTIFDLPPAQSVLRFTEFVERAHPVLQLHCARCHDERHTGSFQLVPARGRRKLPPEVIRANLDSALGLVDQKNLTRSELLTVGLMPHGSGPNKRPIFRSSNDPAYRHLAAWVAKLRPVTPDDKSRPGSLAGSAPSAETFAADRSIPRALPNLEPTPRLDRRPAPPSFPNPANPRPAGQFLPESAAGQPPTVPDNAQFPVPYLLGGEKPKVGEKTAAVPPTAASPARPGDLPPLPPAPAAGAGQQAGEPKKKIKIDPSLLQKALGSRFSSK